MLKYIIILLIILIFIILIFYLINSNYNYIFNQNNRFQIINKNNINNLFINKMKYKNEAFFFGKGPTFKKIKKTNNKQLFVCVNDSINFIEDCDLLVINDIESFNKINTKKLETLKYLLVPYYPHSKNIPSKNISYKNIFKYIIPHFKGKIIIYNLKSGYINHEEYINLYTFSSGSLNSLELVLYYLKNINKIQFYGIGVSNNKGYSTLFVKKNEKDFKGRNYGTEYDNKRILNIKNDITTLCNKYNVSYNLN